jgi:hypothetical protein
MTNRRRTISLRKMFVLTAAIAAWLSVYVALSARIHDPIERPSSVMRKPDGTLVLVHSDEVIGFRPRITYAANSATLRVIFAPIHFLDRLVRPSYWEDASRTANKEKE